ncbi:rho GDP-dissociation inhibitor 1-like isoform X2 [Silene latifolia]|uniref:rho GDP-dissociation inhibitor 1-like isoform X2 n=1 Tax=Silene latifolia TaxID=37657 RepID=UPI003D77BA5E
MSTLVEALPTLNNTNNLSSNMKEEERKMSKKESLCCELRENTEMGQDLRKEIRKKEGHNEENGPQVKEIDSDACLKSNVELSNVDPKCGSNKQLGKHDKADESLSSEKQQIPSSIQVSVTEGNEGSKEAQVQILSLSVISPGRADIVLPIPFPATTSKATLFSLKEGSKYRIKFHLTVSGNTVHNLKYTYMVWKSGIRVHQTKKMVGTFTPREEPYVYELEEGTTPTGFFARGPFFVKSKFVDDDGNCYLDTNYYFDIRKDWGARE